MPLSATWFAIGALVAGRHPAARGLLREGSDRRVRRDRADRDLAWVLASVGAFLSALYIARPLFLTFFGHRRERGGTRTKQRRSMHAPLAVLAFLTVVGGLVLGPDRGGRPSGAASSSRSLGRRRARRGARLSETALTSISIVLAVAAVAVAFWVWASGRVDWEAFPERQPELAGWLANAFYLNSLYAWLVEHPGKAFGRALTVVDDRVIDGAVNEVAEDVVDASGVAPRIQRGFVRSYALAFLLGAVALLLFLGLRA